MDVSNPRRRYIDGRRLTVRTFLQKTTTAQHTTSAKPTTPGRACFVQSRDVNANLHSQRTIGNQAVLRMLRTSAQELEVGLASAASPRSAFDFSRIPIHPKSPASVQAKAAVSSPGDIYEQEADRVAEQVMRMPESQQPGPEQERTQTKPIGSGDLGHIEVPPIVHEVLSSPGQPLDAATRAFFEPRLGHDFGGVRVHTGAVAEQSAQDVNAHAYAVGHDIVFGAGRYAPGTHEGRRLLAHELTHVVQQGAFGQVEPAFIGRPSDRFEREADHVSTAITNPGLPPVGGWSTPIEALANPLMPGGVIQLKPSPDVGAVKDEASLGELARDPREAHRAWKKLNTEDRFIVLDRMARRYGATFADQFREEAQRGRPQFSVTYWQPDSGPTPERLKAGGWRFLEMEVTGSGAIDVEVWVNPSGNTIRRDVSTYRFGQTEKKEVPPKSQEPTDKVTELRKKLENIARQLGPAMADFERNVERLESNPDSEPIKADISRSLKTVRGLITELVNLYNQNEHSSEASAILSSWSSAMAQYSRIFNRYNEIQ
jgi:hypothetical protein